MNNVEFSVLSPEELFSINGGSAKAVELSKVVRQAKIEYYNSTRSSSQSSSRKTSSNTGGGSKNTATQSAPKGKK